jgi:glycosyltransferase involved in cell wall biosynthesis
VETRQNIENEEIDSDAAALRRSLRPALIVSKRHLTEHSTFLRHLLVGMADESIPVALVCPPGYDLESVVPAPAAMFTHPLIDLPGMEHVGIERLAAQLEKFKPTVLHCLCESRAGLTRRLARRLDVPYVLMVNSLARRVQRLSISSRRCVRIIVPGESVRAHVAKSLPRFADRIALINMGSFVNGDAMCFSNPSRLPSIVVAHPIRRVSDFANLLQAVKTLRTDSREFMVVIMGTGRAEHALRKYILALGLSDIVTIVPILNPWRSVMAAGDIFVQPQPLQTFSVFLLEAMAVGTAVAACWGGVDDLIIPNQTAVTFEPGNEPSIRQALKQLLDDRDYARRLAATAQEHILARHSVSAMISATLRTYREAQQLLKPPSQS